MLNEIQRLAKRLNLIEPDEPEKLPYILTPEEEKTAVEHALTSLKKHTAWRLFDKGFGQTEIDFKMSQVDFTAEINKDEILQRCNENKHAALWQQEARRKEKEEAINRQNKLAELWTAEYVYRFMKWTSENVYKTPFIEHEYNRHLITTLCYFISNDKRFETELDYSFDKGLLIRGICGLGKTFLVKCVEKNKIKPIKILSTKAITQSIAATGNVDFDMSNHKILYLDDVGSEEATVVYYGTKYSFFESFIEARSLHLNNHSDLIISTNFNYQGLKEKYGARVVSRLKGEMMNTVDIQGQDMRGLKQIIQKENIEKNSKNIL